MKLALLAALIIAGTLDYGTALTERGQPPSHAYDGLGIPAVGAWQIPRSVSAAEEVGRSCLTAPASGVEPCLALARVRRVGGAHKPPARIAHAIRLASATYGVPYGEAVRVAWCESRWNARARNPTSGASGLMQFMPSTFRSTPYRNLSIFDPYTNALAAGWLWKANGGSWREWVCKP